MRNLSFSPLEIIGFWTIWDKEIIADGTKFQSKQDNPLSNISEYLHLNHIRRI